MMPPDRQAPGRVRTASNSRISSRSVDFARFASDKLPISFLPSLQAEFGAVSWVTGTALPLCMRGGQALSQVLLSSAGSAGGVGTASAPAQPNDAESRPHCFR